MSTIAVAFCETQQNQMRNFDQNFEYFYQYNICLLKSFYSPGNGIRFDSDAAVVGFAVTRNGSLVFTRDADETEAANEL